MSDSSDDNQKPQILTAEYKDGKLLVNFTEIQIFIQKKYLYGVWINRNDNDTHPEELLATALSLIYSNYVQNKIVILFLIFPGQLQIVEVTPFDRDRVNIFLVKVKIGTALISNSV